MSFDLTFNNFFLNSNILIKVDYLVCFHMKYLLNLENIVTLNEKIVWLKSRIFKRIIIESKTETFFFTQ